MGKKYTYQEVKEYIENFGYELLSKEYKNNKTKLKLVCPNGNSWDIRFDHFKNGVRCSCNKCKNNAPLKIEYVREKLQKEGYELLDEVYVNNHTPLTMKCPKGHITNGTTWNNFKNGTRCSMCRESKGEKRIIKWLENNNIDFVSQKKFDGLLGLGNKNLSYDFYLPQYNLLIEYQGEFHDGTAHQQSKEDFKQQQEHDKRKREYAKNSDIQLLEIWYYDFDNIEEILKNELK